MTIAAVEPEECRCGFWSCDYAKRAGWCEANGGDLICRLIGKLCSHELQLEIKHWKEHKFYSRESWAITRIKMIEEELALRKSAGQDLDSFYPPK